MSPAARDSNLGCVGRHHAVGVELARPPDGRRTPAMLGLPALAWLACLLCLALAWSGLGLSCLPCLPCLELLQQQPAAKGGRLLLLERSKARQAGQARQAQARPSQGKAQQASQPSQGDVPVFLTHRHMVGKLCKIMKTGMKQVQVEVWLGGLHRPRPPR